MKYLYSLFLFVLPVCASAQKIDSIHFHLYTDSLKKGVHNYINVDGKLSDGRWLPLTDKEVKFSSSAGKFEGNSLILDTGFAQEKVIVKAVLKAMPSINKEITIYVKKKEEDEKLKTMEEVMEGMRGSKKRKRS